jgi:DNA topoisomerase-3
MRALNVAEKPSVARQAASVLARGRAERRSSCSPYHSNWVWSGPFELAAVDGTRWTAEEMIFTSVSGHLEETDFMPPYHQWASCEPEDLFYREQVPIRRYVPERNAKVARNLQQLARSCQCLVLWLDGDAEGEAISEEVRRTCRISDIMVFRARFSAVTTRDLLHACSSLERLNKNVIEAVSIRQEIDLRAGAAFTRWLTRHIQHNYPQAQQAVSKDGPRNGRRTGGRGLGGTVGPTAPSAGVSSEIISYGPCQFPTLGLVVDRYRERRQFQSQPFWTVQLHIQLARSDADEGSFELAWDRGRLFDRFVAYALFQRLHDLLKKPYTLRLDRCETQSACRNRPLPLSTVELQKQASRKLKLSSAETMEIAEQLYQQGYISYPRTETDRFPTDGRGCVNLKALIALQCDDQRWDAVAKRLLETDDASKGGFTTPRAGSHDDHAHPPIHPTKAAPPGTLHGDAARLYDYIARRFLASCSANALGERTIWRFGVHASAGAMGPRGQGHTSMSSMNAALETFTSRGLRITRLGYLEVFAPYEKWSECTLPGVLQPGAMTPEHFRLTEIRLLESATEAPPLLSEADLIAAMDRHGIGTDATIAEHIKKIQERHYVVKQVIAMERPGGTTAATESESHDHNSEEEDETIQDERGVIVNLAGSRQRHSGRSKRSGVARFVPMKLGIALVEAFERCEVHLARPHLRAEQEARQRLVATGQAQASETLRYLLATFADAFRRLSGNRIHFDIAFSQFFPSAGQRVHDRLSAKPALTCTGTQESDASVGIVTEASANGQRQPSHSGTSLQPQMLGPCASCQMSNDRGVWILSTSRIDDAVLAETSEKAPDAHSAFWIRCSRYPNCPAQLCFSDTVCCVQLVRNMPVDQVSAGQASRSGARTQPCCATCKRSLLHVSWTTDPSARRSASGYSSVFGCVYGCNSDDGIVQAAPFLGWYPAWYRLPVQDHSSTVAALTAPSAPQPTLRPLAPVTGQD